MDPASTSSAAPRWHARTVDGLVQVEVSPDVPAEAHSQLVILQRAGGAVMPARLVSPVIGEADPAPAWDVAGYYRVDPDGTPLSELIPDAGWQETRPSGHDWGALGLADGPHTRVRRYDEPAVRSELATAVASGGYRHGASTRWLTLMPGDQVAMKHVSGTVVAVDRRKRTVALEVAGEMRTFPLDELDTKEFEP